MNKKKLFLIFFYAVISIYAFSLTKIKFENGIKLSFEALEDSSVRFEATGKKASSPVKDFELKRAKAKTDFVKTADNLYVWEQYSVQIIKNGYRLNYGEKELYTSVFSEEKNLLKELRTWKTAKDFFGFGQASRKTSLKNQSFTIYNESKYADHAYIFIPFFITDDATAVYYNAGGKDKIYFQDGNDSQLYRSEYKRIECFVRQDESIKESVKKFYFETETSGLLPKWAYGYIQSKYGYKSKEEALEIADTFINKKIPLDAIVLDHYWFDKMGDIWWTSKAFSEPKEFTKTLHEKGIKLITITEPFFTPSSECFEELKSQNLLCRDNKGKIALWSDWWTLKKDRNGGLFNPLSKNASDFMGRKYSRMIDSGIDGFWTDLGEPERAPSTVKYRKFNEIDFHNYYNLYWTKALYEGVKKFYPEKRLFILSRSAFTGSGKYSVSVWSGDISVSWKSLFNQISFGINTSMSSLPYWGCDTGGFFPEETESELFVRWHQFSCFTPVYRAHGTGKREPWIFTQKEEQLISDSINLRKKLLPYIYSSAYLTMNGEPMMKGMFLESSDCPKEFYDYQYMFGPSLLVSPVISSLASQSEKSVYLPNGIWFDFYNYKRFEGNQEINVKVSMENIPVFVKAASIIPLQETEIINLLVFPENSTENTFTLYDDDGETELYKNGKYGKVVFYLKDFYLKAEISGDKSFIKEKYKISIPGKNGSLKSKTVSLSEIQNGINLNEF